MKGQPPKRYGAMIARVMTLDNEEEPIMYQQAINHPYHRKEWEIAAQEEYDSLMKNETWEVVPRPTNRNVIMSRWVFRHKKGPDREDCSFQSTDSRTWILANLRSQLPGNLLPVAKLVSIRVLFAIAASLDLEIHQMDVVSAFLASKLDEKIYMEFPDGFKNSDKVGLLGKSIYGLKQSARYFNRRFHDHLLRLGFAQTIADPSSMRLCQRRHRYYHCNLGGRHSFIRRQYRYDQRRQEGTCGKVQHERCWRVNILPRHSGQS